MAISFRSLLDLYDNWNGYTVINDKNLNLYARVKTDKIMNTKNYERALNAKVMAFGFNDNELCVRVDTDFNENRI